MAELGALLGGRYRLDQVLGQGGMATIFRATDSKLGREVAVKVLRPEYGADVQFVERFRHEAQAAASLNHPNIVQVYDYGTDPAGPYIVMEQVAGGDLSAVLGERGALPPTAVARTGQQVAEALAAAHARGLVHRDIKPSNILLSPDGRVQVADFGIAQAAARVPVTATGITLGSVLYFSPEQARGDAATSASDIYSLGLVMYEMLTGQRAFSGDSPAAVAVARLSGGVPSPMAVRAEVPPSLDAIVRWCLAPDPTARPAAGELATALSRFITDPSGAATYAMAAGVATTAGVPTVPWTGAAPPPTQTVLLASGSPPPVGPERAGSGPWAWMAAGLGLLVIIASGILLFLLFSGIGEESPTPSLSPSPAAELVVTPDFIDRREENALTLAERRGLSLEMGYRETAETEAGRIIDQLPEAGVEVPPGTSIQVTVATQVETVVVPEVAGIKEQRARAQLEAAGLRPGLRASVSDLLPEGYVVGTEPRAGASVTRDSLVAYTVSSGPATDRPTATPGRTARPTDPPSTEPTAIPTATPTAIPTAAPTAAPMPTPPAVTPPPSTVAPVTQAPPTAPPNPSVPPSPAASPWPSASPSAWPSPFPSHETILLGDFRCTALGEARVHLAEAGLLLGATIPADPPPPEDWFIHDQLPPPGERVPVGSAVDFRLMDPQEPCPAD